MHISTVWHRFDMATESLQSTWTSWSGWLQTTKMSTWPRCAASIWGLWERPTVPSLTACSNISRHAEHVDLLHDIPFYAFCAENYLQMPFYEYSHFLFSHCKRYNELWRRISLNLLIYQYPLYLYFRHLEESITPIIQIMSRPLSETADHGQGTQLAWQWNNGNAMSQIYSGASVGGADLMNKGEADVCVNWAGVRASNHPKHLCSRAAWLLSLMITQMELC